jgi:hypothetical protein
MTARPHRSPPLTYRQAMEVLNDTYLTLLQSLDMRLEANTREQLELLVDRLAEVVARDNGRR